MGHFVDSLEDGLQGVGITSCESFSAGDGRNDGDFGGRGTASNVDGKNRDIVVCETTSDFNVVAIGEVEAGAIGKEDDQTVARLGGEEFFFSLLERLANKSSTVKPVGEFAWVKEGRGVAEGRDIGGEGDPAEVVAPKDHEGKGVSFSVVEEFVERFHGGIVSVTRAKGGRHGAGDIETKHDVGELAFAFGPFEGSWASGDEDKSGEDEIGEGVDEVEEQGEPLAVGGLLVVKGKGEGAGAGHPLEND